MLEKPEIPDDRIAAHLTAEYHLPAGNLTFLPLGADANTAVYRLETPDGQAYFVKLRKGDFDPLSVEIPHFLHAAGLSAIIPIMETTRGRLWSRLESYCVIVYPFIEGQDGYTQEMSAANWLELGRSLHAVHSAHLPDELHRRLPREAYSPRFRRRLHGFLAQIQSDSYTDLVAAELAAAARSRRCEITHMLVRAGRLARRLQTRPLEFVLCHCDFHPGNVHITPDGRLYLVDWDAPMLAPKEHDLMAIGAGMGDDWGAGKQGMWFYQGYGEAQIEPAAIAYYRYERIIQDLVAECELVLLSQTGDEDRRREVGWFLSNFHPGGVYEQAVTADSD